MEIYLQTTLVPLLRGSSHDNGVDHDDDGLDIDTLTTYLLSILEEDLIEWEEKREAITDFLLDHYKLKSSQHIVDALLSHWKTIQDDKARVQEQRRLDELERGKGKAKEELAYQREQKVLEDGLKSISLSTTNNNNSNNSSGGEDHRQSKPQMSKEDKKRREALLAQYGYDLDLVVEGENGEEEIMYTGEGGGSSRSSIGSGGGFDKNRNAEAVKQAEQLRRQQLADAHAQEKMRNKLALEKQRADQEKKSKGTQKREKRRM